MLALLAMLAAPKVLAEDLPGEELPAALRPAIPPPHPRPFVSDEQWTIPDAVLTALRAAEGLSLGQRLDIATRPFLGKLYIIDAAGEGDKDDPDPPSRYDVFDCLTFVEEAMALAMAPDPLYAPSIRDQLRYRGSPSYQNRRHFMEAQWLPDAAAAGLISDLTVALGATQWQRKELSPQLWNGWGKRRSVFFRLPDELLPSGVWSLPILDLEQAVQVLPRLPVGALLLTVRAERNWQPTNISHVGLVVRGKDGQPWMRHASRMGQQLVREDRLSWYIENLHSYRRPVAGISVWMPREQGPRRSAMLPAGSGSEAPADAVH
ncbi:MAG TPA: DUF1460 domain-containing protein [Myxococcota bacterium]|nr:DUF1460 domain-containing protein [Myxococcota bacterium]